MGRSSGLFAFLMLVVGCTGGFPWSARDRDPVRVPSVVGVVEERTQLVDGGKAYRLESGKTVEIPPEAIVLLGGEPLAGELFLAGEDPDGREWVAGVSLSTAGGRPAGCFIFPDVGRGRDGWIEMGSGFRFRKAADFSDWRSPATDEYTSDRGAFCLNGQGEVTSYVG